MPEGRGANISTELLSHRDVATTMIDLQVMNRGGLSVKSTLDRLCGEHARARRETVRAPFWCGLLGLKGDESLTAIHLKRLSWITRRRRRVTVQIHSLAVPPLDGLVLWA
jgi:hypothetical protein